MALAASRAYKAGDLCPERALVGIQGLGVPVIGGGSGTGKAGVEEMFDRLFASLCIGK